MSVHIWYERRNNSNVDTNIKEKRIYIEDVVPKFPYLASNGYKTIQSFNNQIEMLYKDHEDEK